MKPDVDVIVAGGGMVGACLAALCAQVGGQQALRVAVIEPKPPAAFDPSSEVALRVSAVSRASQRILQAAGAWLLISRERVGPYREMRIWDAGDALSAGGGIHFDSAEIGESDLGHIIENNLMQWALWECLAGLKNVELINKVALESLEFSDDAVTAELNNGRVLTARLIVGADGARSRVRELAGIETRGWGYDQKAVVAHVKTEAAHGETAWQRFLSTGPLAFLPLADGRSSIVWSTTLAQADELLALDPDAFNSEVTRASDRVLGKVVDSGQRAAFPLRLQHATRYTCPRCALIGDAAHAVHPLAGQGVNLGYLDAAALTEVVVAAQTAGHDPGDHPVLRRYERWRKGENLFSMATMDGFKRLFGNSSVTVGYGRRAGLRLVNRATPLKNLFMRRAMGLSGDLPKLAR